MITRKRAGGVAPVPPTLTERDVVLRRFDLAARAAVLAAGLYAQAAMWVLGHSRLYAVAAVVLIGVSIESARRPLARFVAPRHRWRDFSQRQLLAARVVAGVVVVEICLVVIGSLHVTDVHAMATPIGVLLVTVQAAQAMAVESRRDLKLACMLIIAMLVQVGALTTTASVQLPMVFCLVLVAVASGLLQRGSTIADVDAIALPGHAPLTRAAVFPAAAAAVVGVLVFVVLPNSANLGVQAHVRHFGGQSRPAAGSASAAPSAAPGSASGSAGSASTSGSAPASGSAAAGTGSAGQGRPISDAGTTRLDLRVRGPLSDA
ncbi:MAG: hypothetical protein QOH29_2890, partial [Actinomycetota bacterium]|nr:hypothetical protein [Actinomycetota bacterium]